MLKDMENNQRIVIDFFGLPFGSEIITSSPLLILLSQRICRLKHLSILVIKSKSMEYRIYWLWAIFLASLIWSCVKLQIPP